VIRIDDQRCTGCGACVTVCPTGAIRLAEDAAGYHAEVDETKCQECEACLQACPEKAIVSDVESTLEGELIEVKATPLSVEPPPREMRLDRLTPETALQVRTWLGAALAFAGREIVPRLAASLLDTWDRRASRSTPSTGRSMSVRPVTQPGRDLPSRGGRRQRRQRRRG
jgi:NAD-dependent dihydropyrimidine dehydrogenase PreA subunit